MNAPASITATILDGESPEILRRIDEPGVALAIWRRRPDPAFTRWIDALPPDHLPGLRARVAASDVTAAVLDACESSGLADQPMRTRLAEDAGALAAICAEILDSPFLGIRLDVIDTDACRRFHMDRVRARLLCTYRGSGTEYGLAGPGGTDPARPERLGRAEAGLFRGSLWPAGISGTGPCLVHRSPPIAGSGETRLLLVLDALHDDSEDDDEDMSR